MGKKGDLSDFERGMVVSKTADLLEIFTHNHL